jgi:hypothetical protein
MCAQTAIRRKWGAAATSRRPAPSFRARRPWQHDCTCKRLPPSSHKLRSAPHKPPTKRREAPNRHRGRPGVRGGRGGRGGREGGGRGRIALVLPVPHPPTPWPLAAPPSSSHRRPSHRTPSATFPNFVTLSAYPAGASPSRCESQGGDRPKNLHPHSLHLSRKHHRRTRTPPSGSLNAVSVAPGPLLGGGISRAGRSARAKKTSFRARQLPPPRRSHHHHNPPFNLARGASERATKQTKKSPAKR